MLAKKSGGHDAKYLSEMLGSMFVVQTLHHNSDSKTHICSAANVKEVCVSYFCSFAIQHNK